MRTFAIGDIHGCATALDLILLEIELQPTDVLVTLGDYVDRGPDSKGVINRLLGLQNRVQLIALRGNHEIMMLQARDNPAAEETWRFYGGDTTISSYGSDALADIPDEHWDFIENQCVRYWENDTHFFVHANAYPKLPLFQQPNDRLFWRKFDYPEPHISGKIMICGHTSQQSGLPVHIGHAICLDTWAYGDGWLSCLNLQSGQLWQANQAGEQRQMWLNEL